MIISFFVPLVVAELLDEVNSWQAVKTGNRISKAVNKLRRCINNLAIISYQFPHFYMIRAAAIAEIIGLF
ncbi:MAG: hypothetical protein QNJ63_02030 [Calothrix sp. MO_192.B10]|nr:hypothetical protein [Calothrix sp. MO_192.B10]